MPVFSPVRKDDNSIGYPLGIHFKLIQVFEDGRKADVTLIKTEKKTVFYGLFDVEDTDFELIVDNTSGLRNIRVIVYGRDHVYSHSDYIYISRELSSRGQSKTLSTLRSNGKPLHFNKSTIKGRIPWVQSVLKNSNKELVVNLSKIKLFVNVEKTPALPQFTGYGKVFKVQLVGLAGLDGLNLTVDENWTVGAVKNLYEVHKGVPSDELIISFNRGIAWKGNQPPLMDDQTLKELGLVDGNVLDLVRTQQEQGVVEEADQQFGAQEFVPSDEIELKPITVELRMKSEYSLDGN